ncbi:hypothetical protein H0H87_004201 [Tephrocybe sp. NHM501043]|nr:hypothetical protein H0H87_004201 [Tephrocybe sp. NHM501043]
MSLATKKMAKRYEKQKAEQTGTAHASDDEVDLFSRDQIKSIRKRIKKTTKKLDATLDNLKAKVGRGSKESDREEIEEDGKETLQSQSHSNGIPPLEGLPELFHAPSRGSHASKKSKASKASKDYPVFDPAAPAAISLVDDSDEEDDDDHAFDHPSTYVEQPWIWIPSDKLGLSTILKEDLTAVGVDADDLGAFMDWRGNVDVKRNPPDEEWQGGHDN